jgi:hypothetical protein
MAPSPKNPAKFGLDPQGALNAAVQAVMANIENLAP